MSDFAFILSEKAAIDKEKELGLREEVFWVYAPDITQPYIREVLFTTFGKLPGIGGFPIPFLQLFGEMKLI